MNRRWTLLAALLLAAWPVAGCGSREVKVEADLSEMTPEQQALFEHMRRVEDERNRMELQTGPPQPGPRGVQPPGSPSY